MGLESGRLRLHMVGQVSVVLVYLLRYVVFGIKRLLHFDRTTLLSFHWPV